MKNLKKLLITVICLTIVVLMSGAMAKEVKADSEWYYVEGSGNKLKYRYDQGTLSFKAYGAVYLERDYIYNLIIDDGAVAHDATKLDFSLFSGRILRIVD